jgi:AbrB family looped-hinge helix DNA binding protein
MASQDVATLSSKFQISIPKAVRSARKWQPGQKFAFIPKDGGVMLVPVPRQEDLAGSMRGANTENYRDRNDRYWCASLTPWPGLNGAWIEWGLD